MNKRTRPPLLRVFCGSTALVLGLAGLSACHTATHTNAYKTLGWENHRLPNAAVPYDKLLVEVDAVEGTEPSYGELADLKSFLERLTNKPGGVTVKLDDSITLANGKGRAPDSLALEYLNGPTDEQTAFIYILCYRSRLNRFFAKAENPNFTHFPYPSAIFLNRSYAFGLFSIGGRARQLMLRHEVGHALGLARSETHSSRGHCTNPACLMRPAINFNLRRLLTFRSPFDNAEICVDCLQDLESYKSKAAPAGARFWHGYFVRSGEGYHLFTLPGLVYVHFGKLADVDSDTLTRLRRKAIVDVAARGDCNYETHFDLPDATEALCRFLERETEDEGFQEFAGKILASCLAKAEAMRDSDLEQARAFASAALVSASTKFPELQARLQNMHDILAVGAQAKNGADAAGR